MSIEIKISKRRISYKIAMKILHKRVEKLKANKGNELLWILEHPLTYTAGIRTDDKEALDTITMVYKPKLVAKRFSLNDIKKAFIEAENGEGVKYLISPN